MINIIHQTWKRWVSSFELFISASAVTCDTQKRALLLHCAGPNVQDIFGTLSNTGCEYAIALSKLNIYFTPIVNVPYTRHVFRQMKQNEGEIILQFVTRLRIVANDCHYGNNRDDFVRDQVIEKCLQKSLRVKFLSERGITLSKLLEMSQAHESANHQENQMQSATASSSSSNTCADVNFTSQKKFDKKHKSEEKKSNVESVVIMRMNVALKPLTIRAERSTPNIKINVVNPVLTVFMRNNWKITMSLSVIVVMNMRTL